MGHRAARRRKHRLWTVEEKRSICMQTRAPGVSVAQVARRYALNANLIFKWLKDPRFAPLETAADGPLFLPVEIDGRDTPDQTSADLVNAERQDSRRVEIMLGTGHRLSIEGSFDGAAIAELLKALTER